MNISVSRNDVVWSYLSYILQTGSGIFLLPLILKFLEPADIGIWYIFNTIYSFTLLLDFGLQPTITRNVSYIYSGAKKLLSEGIINVQISSVIDYSLLKSLISTVKRIYFLISICIAALLFSVGTIYIGSLVKSSQSESEIVAAFFMYSLSIILNFYFFYYTPLLNGQGKIAQANQTLVLSKITFLIVSMIGLYLGYKLMALAFGNLCGSIVNRVSSHIFFYDNSTKKSLNSVSGKNTLLFKVLWKNSYKMGIVSVGSFLISRSSLLLSSLFLSLETVAVFGLTQQIVLLIFNIASIFLKTQLPVINQLQIKHDNEGIKKTFGKSIVIMTSVYLMGSLCVLFFGDLILIGLNSETLLFNKTLLVVYLIIIYLELFHTSCATLLTTKNYIPFVWSSVISGVSVLLFTFIMLKFFGLGLWGVVISWGVVQLSYNNWKWPVEVKKDLKVNFIRLFKIGAVEIFQTKV